MPAAYYKIEIEQGATWRRVLTLRDQQGTVDLTGYSARMQVRESTESPAALLELTSDGQGIVIDGPAGQLTLLITDETSSAWTWRYGVYDLELEAPDGDVERLLRGEVEVAPEVTR